MVRFGVFVFTIKALALLQIHIRSSLSCCRMPTVMPTDQSIVIQLLKGVVYFLLNIMKDDHPASSLSYELVVTMSQLRLCFFC